nr:hypothetical protein [Candidatus Sigynarchaeum springense]
MYMWRNHYAFGWKIVDGHLCLISTKEAGKIKVFPPGWRAPGQRAAIDRR